MNISGMDETVGKFMIELFNQTNGDLSVQVSMYEIGEAIGLDRSDALKTAEELFGLRLAAVKTLSGGIRITDDGVSEAHRLGCGAGDAAGSGPVSLEAGPYLDEVGCRAIEKIVVVLKAQAGENSWEFESLTELMADLKTIDAQMISPRPKTAIIRECFRSMKAILEKAGNTGSLEEIEQLLAGS